MSSGYIFAPNFVLFNGFQYVDTNFTHVRQKTHIFKIIKNYEYYSKQALLAYEKYYNLDNQIPKIFKEVVKAVESIKSRILSD